MFRLRCVSNEQNNIKTRTLKQGRGLDHGVFVPFKLMFPTPCPIPIIEVSMDGSLDPQRLIELGKALIPLRYTYPPKLPTDVQRRRSRHLIRWSDNPHLQ